MQDLGMKVVTLNIRLNKLDKKLNLTRLPFTPKYSSGYNNLLVNRVDDLNKRVVRLERAVGTATNQRTKSDTLLKNVAMKINTLCQRIIKLERQIELITI